MSTTCHQKAQSLGIAPCGGKQPPATHHPQWPAQFQQLVEVARYKQDCATGSRELAQHPMDVGRSAQVESARDIMRDQSAPYRDLESTSSFRQSIEYTRLSQHVFNEAHRMLSCHLLILFVLRPIAPIADRLH